MKKSDVRVPLELHPFTEADRDSSMDIFLERGDDWVAFKQDGCAVVIPLDQWGTFVQRLQLYTLMPETKKRKKAKK